MDYNRKNLLKSKTQVICLNLFLASFGLYYGFHFTIFNSLYTHFLKNKYFVSNENIDIVFSNVFFFFALGALLGIIISSIILNLLGRKNSIILFLILSFCLPILFLNNNLHVLYIARFLIGSLAGVYLSVSTSWIHEYVPLSYRKLGTIFFNTFIVIGFFFGFLFGYIYGNKIGENWFISIYLFSIVDIIKIILFYFLIKFESPVYSYSKNKNEDIKKYFDYYYKPEYSDIELKNFIK